MTAGPRRVGERWTCRFLRNGEPVNAGVASIGGEESDIDVGWRAALAAVEGLEGREGK